MTTPITIVFPIYTGVTHLDFTGPHQFLSRLPNAKVTVASVDAAAVTTAEALTFSDLADLQSIESCDVLCVPGAGGAGCTDAMQNPIYMAAISRLAATARYVTSVCTGSLILGAAGLLRGRRATSHWAWRDMLTLFGATPDAGRVVRDKEIITGGGVTAGIDFALILIAELAGPDVAQSIQLGLEYSPEPPFHAGRPETAPPHIVDVYQARIAQPMAERYALVERIANAAG
ncbi:transcriptional regulator GlxA family with amidase domain [Rhodanobacter sp. K2T2]|uniref:DJ-1/PfpI family protein n=1 Tax=Rhodanobacter sp. K2T2 TaxID=2723085 RepID=UPI0015CCEDD2|nr:DJ-1/PfpI family protein [Rhodanobacter sp. K2T2]NYE28601.1 transcriptional regulator GlxA family with amidase domain [Rhodanobacter sp. K2T2]